MSQKYRLSLKVRHLEVLWNTEKYFKKFNIIWAKLKKKKSVIVEVFDCCVTSQAHQNDCLGIQ
jgi:hypothetical protein